MQTKRMTIAFVLIALLSFIFLPVSQSFGGEPKYGGTLKFGVRSPQYKGMDARYPLPETVRPVFPIIYDTLYDWGKEGSKGVEPALATKIETDDHKTFMIHLRKGAKFHNGREMTAKDIKTNIDWRINTPKGWRPLKYKYHLKYLKEVQVVDKYTAKIVLEKPFTVPVSQSRCLP